MSERAAVPPEIAVSVVIGETLPATGGVLNDAADDIVLDNGRVRLRVTVVDGIARLAELVPSHWAGADDPPPAMPLVEVSTSHVGPGGRRHSERNATRGLRFESADTTQVRLGSGAAPAQQLRVVLADPDTGLCVESFAALLDGSAVVRTWSRVTNAGTSPLLLTQVSSLVVGTLVTDADGSWDEQIRLSVPHNVWGGECQWREASLVQHGIYRTYPSHQREPVGSRHSLLVSNAGSWSTSDHLPMGLLHDTGRGLGLLWQIEHNGAWCWEVADWNGGLYLLASGPTGADHEWREILEPGEQFISVAVATAVIAGGGDGDLLDTSMAEMTRYRRAVRRPHADNATLPVIFNDYMNCLEGDPSQDKILPLIHSAAELGAEYFVVDAGWYAEDGDWWDSVGAWEESRARFPQGLREVLNEVRGRGMVPGLWLEPEVVGVRSPLLGELTDDMLFCRDGTRLEVTGRYQLDFRHPAVVARLDRVVNRLVADYGLGYVKFDYNIDAGHGTDIGCASPGAGLLGHNRAYLRWVAGVMDRHPGLVIENCGSGGLRMDYATLALHPVQSTTDQRDHLKIAAIAAAAPTAVTPEQGAVWAYPQPHFTAEENAFTVAVSLLSRVHLSGRVDLLSPEQTALVGEGLAVYRALRGRLPDAVPLWPLGLPGWNDDWVSLALRTADETYVLVARRAGERTAVLPLRHLAGQLCSAEVIFPVTLPTQLAWDDDEGKLTIELPPSPAARLVRLHGRN
ncbi:alpha-galactosidase [Micromonospora sp. NPDC005205]|uniref:alpha-galactosidase n=1 Tax=Micromonospora sp. NPDC005205 TaxID=3156714 RepID=UPI0033B04347